MDILDWCGMATTFSLFAAVAWRLAKCQHPLASFNCRVRWMIGGALHIAVAVSAMAWMLDHWRVGDQSEWHLCVLRGSLALLLVVRWTRRSSDL